MTDPRTKLGLLAAASVVALALDQPTSLGMLTALCALPVVLLRPGWRWLGRGALGMAMVVWSTALSQGLFYSAQPRVPALVIGPLTLYREGLEHGLVQSLRFLASGMAGLALVLSTSPERLFAALLALRVPFGVAFLAVTALRALPEIGAEWLAVRRARARRGRPAWQRSPWAWVGLELSLLRPVVARALRRARALAESLDARGFDPAGERGQYRPLHMKAGEKAALAGAAAVATVAVGMRLLYVLYTAELLYVPAWRGLYGFVRRWL